MPTSYPECFVKCVSLTDLLSSVMRRAVHGIPSVINVIELMAGLMKARPVVIPERMPMTILNLDLEKQRDREKKEIHYTYEHSCDLKKKKNVDTIIQKLN